MRASRQDRARVTGSEGDRDPMIDQGWGGAGWYTMAGVHGAQIRELMALRQMRMTENLCICFIELGLSLPVPEGEVSPESLKY